MSSSPIYTVPVHAIPAPIPTNVALTESADLWHRRLGHYGASVLETLKKSSFGRVNSVFSQLYTTCNLAKSHAVSFVSTEHRTVSPSELIHSHVWQSPVQSHHGFKYYVLFIDNFSRFTWLSHET